MKNKKLKKKLFIYFNTIMNNDENELCSKFNKNINLKYKIKNNYYVLLYKTILHNIKKDVFNKKKLLKKNNS